IWWPPQVANPAGPRGAPPQTKPEEKRGPGQPHWVQVLAGPRESADGGYPPVTGVSAAAVGR
ncbi:hypothetical protein, partial [Mycobacterium avium]|uniref:hypothetical protein n=1 Tax=Mycobacterium avium TaxID=1764 RepID=UPI001F2948B2